MLKVFSKIRLESTLRRGFLYHHSLQSNSFNSIFNEIQKCQYSTEIYPKILISPSKYIQGNDVTEEIGNHMKYLGNKVFFVGGERGLGSVRTNIENSFKENDMEYIFEFFNGECCQEEVDRLTEFCQMNDVSVVCGVGGGKAIDTAKLIGAKMNIRTSVLPTLCATDAPCSALSVLYTPDGVFSEYVFFDRNPDLVMVDTRIVANAPVSGIGDALATYFEAEQATMTRKQSCAGGSQTVTSLALAKLCYETLMEYGSQAVLSCQRNSASPAFEKVCEANTLLSGIGFESCGLAAAHAIHNGLTSLDETHEYLHGEKVNLGTLAQLVLQSSPKEIIEQVFEFCVEIGLPCTLEQIGIQSQQQQDDDDLKSKLLMVGETACVEGETIHNMPFPVTPEMVVDAILVVDELGKKYLNKD